MILVVLLLATGAACSNGSASDAGPESTDRSSTTQGASVGTVGTVPEVEPPTPDADRGDGRSVAEVIESLEVSGPTEVCVRLRLDEDPDLADAEERTLARAAAGCQHLVERVVPVYVGSLSEQQELDETARACVAEGLYRLSDQQIDSIGAAMVAPGADGAARARELLITINEECGIA